MTNAPIMREYADESLADDPPTLSVIVPAYNEQATLIQLLRQVVEEPTRKEIIIVEDGSSDNTANIIAAWICDEFKPDHQTCRVVWLEHLQNLGKGAAIRSGLQVAMGYYVVVQDADLEVLPENYSKLLEPLISGRAEFVVGTRFCSRERRWSFHHLGVRLLNYFVKVLYGYRLSDTACCFKILSRKDFMAMDLQCMRFEFCPEVVSKASRMHLRVAEVPIPYMPRSAAEGKKLRLIVDGFQAILTLFRYRKWKPEPASRPVQREPDVHAVN